MFDCYEHPEEISNVIYVTTSIPSCPKTRDDFDEQYNISCQCIRPEICSRENSCPCIIVNQDNYLKVESKLLLSSDSLFIKECSELCLCSNLRLKTRTDALEQSCGNRYVQFGPHESLEVFQTAGKGLGLRSNTSIQRGEFICEYAGEFITEEEGRKRSALNSVQSEMNYVFALYEHFSNRDEHLVTCVDCARFGNIGRFINHSCDPNCKVLPVRVKRHTPMLAIFSAKDIAAGEEITFDYGGSHEERQALSKQKCLCASAKCRNMLPGWPS